MCIRSNNTIHNCKSKTIHAFNHKKFISSLPRNTTVYSLIEANFMKNKKKDLFGLIQRNNQIKYFTGEDMLNMIAKMRSFFKQLYQIKEKEFIPENVAEHSHENILHEKNTQDIEKSSKKLVEESESYNDSHFKKIPLKVGIYLDTSFPYILTDLALQSLNIPSVSIYSTHGKEAVSKIIQDNKINLIIMDKKVYESEVKDNDWGIDVIVCDREIHLDKNKSEIAHSEPSNHQLYDLNTILSDPSHKEESSLSIESNVVTVLYTSGTTSDIPKKQYITQQNLMSMIYSFRFGMEEKLFKEVEFLAHSGENAGSLIHLSYLPLSHILERLLTYLLLTLNVKIIYYNGNKKKLKNDFKLVKPDLLIGAPRVFEHIENMVKSNSIGKISISFKKWLLSSKENVTSWLTDSKIQETFREGYHSIKLDNSKLHSDTISPKGESANRNLNPLKIANKKAINFSEEQKKKNSILNKFKCFFLSIFLFFVNLLLFLTDNLIFKKIRSAFGGRIKFIFCGGALIRKDLKFFMEKIVFNQPFYEVYGMSESTGVISVNTNYNYKKNKNTNQFDLMNNNGVGYPIFPVECIIFKNELLIRGINVGKESQIEPEMEKEIEQEMENVYTQNKLSGEINWGNQENNIKKDISHIESENQRIRSKDEKCVIKCYSAPQYSNKWYRTGDRAMILNGNIHITGRMNNNFKTSLGEFIVPERIERIIQELGKIQEIIIIGKRDKNYLIAVVFMNGCENGFLCDSNKKKSRDTKDNEKNENILQCKHCNKNQSNYCHETFNSLKKSKELNSYELPKKIIILNKSVYNIKKCFVESTMKLRRKGVMEVFQKEIEECYADQ